MCANVETTLGPELALLAQRTPESLRNAIALSVLRDELEGASAEWTVRQEARSSNARPAVRFGLGVRWIRRIGHLGSPPHRAGAHAPT